MLFSAVAKVAAALTVAVGLPLIARVLSTADYSIFLQAISVSTLLGFVFWPLSTGTVTFVAKQASSPNLERLVQPTLRPFALAGLVICLLTLLAMPAAGLHPFIALAVGLTAVQMTANWAESWRLALRTDHITSSFQAVASIAVVVAILLARSPSLFITGAIYFLVPAILATMSFALVFRGMRRAALLRAESGAGVPLREAIALIFVATPDYGRIYGCGWILAVFASPEEYAKYFTIILFVARLVNPLSLITRPLLPAYLHALHAENASWIRRANLAITGGCAAALVLIPLLALAVPLPHNLPLLPDKWGLLNRSDIFFLALYCGSAIVAALVSPLYLATGRLVSYGVIGNAAIGLGLFIGWLMAPSGGAVAVINWLAVGMAAMAVVYLAGIFWIAPHRETEAAETEGESVVS
jgi:hypothetical protein